MIEKTIHDTFIFRSIISKISHLILNIAGWKLKGRVPLCNKCVIILSPHTSNWDGILGSLIVLKLNLRSFIMAKKRLFKFPIKTLLLWLGLVPIEREKKNNVVDQIVQEFNKRDKFKIFIVPSGTRTKVKSWRTGFYNIAKKADVPIILSFIDYKRKEYGFIGKFHPQKNMKEDIEKIQSIYREKKIMGRHPKKQILFPL